MERLRVDRLSVAHHAHDGELPLNDLNAKVLGLHLPALLVGYDEPAVVLLRPVRVPFWPGMVPIVVAAVVVHPWRRRSGGRGFSVVGGPWRLGWGFRRGNKGVGCGHCMQDDPQGITHWVIGADGGWRGALGPEGCEVKREG